MCHEVGGLGLSRGSFPEEVRAAADTVNQSEFIDGVLDGLKRLRSLCGVSGRNSAVIDAPGNGGGSHHGRGSVHKGGIFIQNVMEAPVRQLIPEHVLKKRSRLMKQIRCDLGKTLCMCCLGGTKQAEKRLAVACGPVFLPDNGLILRIGNVEIKA